TPGPVVDAEPANARQSVGIDAPSPADMPAAVVLLGPFALEQCFGSTVSGLLLQISADRRSAAVPDDGRRTETELPAMLLKLPADVDVVPGHMELWVETTDRTQRFASEGHVATWDVLGFLVRDEDMLRPSGRVGDALGDEPLPFGWDV